jgi:hypothetical protein
MNDQPSEPGYTASAWMAALVTDVDRLGLLEGELREQIANTLELFRTQGKGGADPDQWHVELYDFYEQPARPPAEAAVSSSDFGRRPIVELIPYLKERPAA